MTETKYAIAFHDGPSEKPFEHPQLEVTSIMPQYRDEQTPEWQLMGFLFSAASVASGGRSARFASAVIYSHCSATDTESIGEIPGKKGR